MKSFNIAVVTEILYSFCTNDFFSRNGSNLIPYNNSLKSLQPIESASPNNCPRNIHEHYQHRPVHLNGNRTITPQGSFKRRVRPSVLVRRNMSHSRGSVNASLYGSSPKENQLLPPPSPLRSPQQPGSFRFQRRENSIVRRRGLMGQHSFNCPRTSCTTGAFRRRESSAYASCAANSGKPPLPTFLSRRNTITVGVHTNPPLSLRDIYKLSRQGSLHSRHSLLHQPSLCSLSLSSHQTVIPESSDARGRADANGKVVPDDGSRSFFSLKKLVIEISSLWKHSRTCFYHSPSLWPSGIGSRLGRNRL